VSGRYRPLPLSGSHAVAYWNEEGFERTELLGLFVAYLLEHRWGVTLDSGWAAWDLEVYCHPWTVVQVCTAQEDYGGRRRLVRVRFRLRPSGYMKALGLGTVLTALAALGLLAWPAGLEARLLLAACAAGGAVCLGLWRRGTCRAAQVVAVLDAMAGRIGLVHCGSLPRQGKAPRGASAEGKAPATA
jgi:hypothetical protein